MTEQQIKNLVDENRRLRDSHSALLTHHNRLIELLRESKERLSSSKFTLDKLLAEEIRKEIEPPF